MLRCLIALLMLQTLMADENGAVADHAAASGHVPDVSLLHQVICILTGQYAGLSEVADPSWNPRALLYDVLCLGFAIFVGFSYIGSKSKKRSRKPCGEPDSTRSPLPYPRVSSAEAQLRAQTAQSKAAMEKFRLSKLLNTHANNGNVEEMTRTLELIERRCRPLVEMADYHSVIVHLARGGEPTEARKWLRRAVELGLQPQHSSYTTVIRAYVKMRDYVQAEHVAGEMTSAGLQFDRIMYNTMMHLCLCTGDAANGQRLMKEMLAEGVKPDAVTFATIMQLCSSVGLLEDLDVWFRLSREQGFQLKLRTFDSMLGDFARRDDVASAMKWMTIMIDTGVPPDANCFHRVLTIVAKKVDVDCASRLVAMMRQVGLENNDAISIYNRCIMLAAAQGHVSEAAQWADECMTINGSLAVHVRQALQVASLQVSQAIESPPTVSGVADVGVDARGCEM